MLRHVLSAVAQSSYLWQIARPVVFQTLILDMQAELPLDTAIGRLTCVWRPACYRVPQMAPTLVAFLVQQTYAASAAAQVRQQAKKIALQAC